MSNTLQQLASKILAQAIVEVFPGSLLVGGGNSNIQFYYSVVLPQKIDLSMLCLLEEKMRGIIKSKPEFRITEMMPRNAAAYFEHHQQPILAEKAEEIEDALIDIIEIGRFKDLCNPHDLPDEFETFFFELIDLEIVGQDREFIAKISGTASQDKDIVKKTIKHYRQAKKFDHKNVGLDLQLFTPLTSEQWVWLPRGEQIKNSLLSLKLNALKVEIPQDLDPTALGFPHNSPFDAAPAWHTWLYQNSNFSPAKYTSIVQKSEFSNSPQFNGFLLNSSYTQDLSHFYCNTGELEKELIYYLQFVSKIIKIFGFEVQWILRSTRPNSKAKASDWDQGVKALTLAAQTLGLNVEISKAPGASNGPKLEALFYDAFGQQWSGSFIQVDCCHPKLKMKSSLGNAHHKEMKGPKENFHLALNAPKMIALSVWGSLERMVALLVEQRQGKLQWPTFLDEVRGKMNSINEESVSSIES